MAKADGIVTRDEIAAFREVFRVPEEDEQNVARLFNMARRDAHGFEPYARPDLEFVPARFAGFRGTPGGALSYRPSGRQGY